MEKVFQFFFKIKIKSGLGKVAWKSLGDFNLFLI
jgi:hypothetical protein